MIKLGTCIFRDTDGKLKTIDMDKVIALVSIDEKQEEINGELTNVFKTNIETTEKCTEFDKKYIEKDFKNNFVNTLKEKLK